MGLGLLSIFILIGSQFDIIKGEISCSSVIQDTCYIEANTEWKKNNGNFMCNSTYSNCQIDCIGDKSCGAGSAPHNPYIICPVNGHNCIINCIGV